MRLEDSFTHRFNRPVSIKELLESLRHDALLGPAIRCSKLLECWEDIVGARFAGRVKPVEVKNSVLTVLVPNSAWAHEFMCFSASIKKSIRKTTGINVERIRCKVYTNDG